MRSLTAILTVTLLAAAFAAVEPELLELDGDLSPVHDPALIQQGAAFYLFTTGGHIRRSTDLHHWTHIGRVFDQLPAWAASEIPGVRGGYWAPDISVYHGVYRLYYAVSTFGKNDSAIGLATNQTLDPESPGYQWIDRGLVLRSHKTDDFNAIDPNLAVDEHGRHWLAFGSFWSGIKMRRIDPETGKLSPEDTTLYSLANRAPATKPNSIEAPFIVRHAPYYYLFVSFDFCCRGVRSTYNVVVGRASENTGPYLDNAGRPMLEGGGLQLITGTSRWKGPGHEAVLLRSGAPDLFVFHAYDGFTGKPFLKISTLLWEDGWPRVAPLPNAPDAITRDKSNSVAVF